MSLLATRLGRNLKNQRSGVVGSVCPVLRSPHSVCAFATKGQTVTNSLDLGTADTSIHALSSSALSDQQAIARDTVALFTDEHSTRERRGLIVSLR